MGLPLIGRLPPPMGLPWYWRLRCCCCCWTCCCCCCCKYCCCAAVNCCGTCCCCCCCGWWLRLLLWWLLRCLPELDRRLSPPPFKKSKYLVRHTQSTLHHKCCIPMQNLACRKLKYFWTRPLLRIKQKCISKKKTLSKEKLWCCFKKDGSSSWLSKALNNH